MSDKDPAFFTQDEDKKGVTFCNYTQTPPIDFDTSDLSFLWHDEDFRKMKMHMLPWKPKNDMGSESVEKRITSELTTVTAIEMENVHNQEFIWERDSSWPEKWEKQRREELWTVSEFWILVISVKWYLPCSTKKRIHISVWDNHTTTDAMAEGWTDAMHPLDQIKSVVLTNNVFQEVNYAMELWGIVERTKGLVKERSEITDN